MRRGQTPTPTTPADPNTQFSKRELLEASGLSPKTFDTIRKAARVKGPSHGGMDWAFTAEDVRALIHKALGGTFTDRGPPAAAAWKTLLEERGYVVAPENQQHGPPTPLAEPPNKHCRAHASSYVRTSTPPFASCGAAPVSSL